MVQARTVTATHTAPAGAPPARFLARLPAKLAGASLWAVEAEDHYLRLHTSKGQDLILLRLADALGELEGIEGARTHRSWWVARDAVAAVERAEGRTTLTLPDGAKAPVSRTNWNALAVSTKGSTFAVSLNGKTLYEVEDTTIAGPGKVGIWTKGDSVMLFDDLSIENAK